MADPLAAGVGAARRHFFDADRVLAATAAAERRVVTRFAAFVWRRMRSSIRRRKRVSLPGQPPAGHTDLLRRFVRFAWDEGTRSAVVVVGAAKINKPGQQPRTLEHGGTAVRDGRVLTYRPRPFARPALDAERPKFARLWKGQVTR